MGKIIIRNARPEDYLNQNWIISPVYRARQTSKPTEASSDQDQPSSASDERSTQTPEKESSPGISNQE